MPITLCLCLAVVLQDPEAVRKTISEFEAKLHKLDEKDRVPLVRAFFGSLKDSTTRIAALDMLDGRYVSVIPGSMHVEILRPLLKDADGAVRIRAAGAVAYTGSGASLADELAALLAETEAGAKVAALHAMGRSGSPKFAVPLREHLASDDVVVRRAAARAYGQWSTAQATALLPLLKDADAEVRAIAAAELGRAGYAWAGDSISRLLSDPEPRVRTAAIHALAALHQHAGLVRQRLDDTDVQVRGQAAVALGAMDARDHIDAVAALLLSKELSLRSAAISGLSHFNDAAILRHLSPLLADPDATLRRQAREALRMWANLRDADALHRELEALVLRLGGDDVEERDRAQRDLVAAGRRSIEPLKAAKGNSELTSRAKASLDEIRWGEPMRVLSKKLDEANASTERRFELIDSTSDLTKRWFPEVRVMTLCCTWQRPELSSIVGSKAYMLDPCWDEPFEGDGGVNRLLERYPVKLASLDDAKEFVAFMGSLGIPSGVPQRDTLVVKKTETGYEGRRDFGKVADIYTLRVENGQLRGVMYERK